VWVLCDGFLRRTQCHLFIFPGQNLAVLCLQG
jgi:hypothetical protein